MILLRPSISTSVGSRWAGLRPHSISRAFAVSPVSLWSRKGSIGPSKDELEATYKTHPILKRVPRFLRPYTTRFIGAPVSHVTAFLILHELTAIVPLVGFWYLFHQYHDVFMSASMDLPAWALEKGTKVIDKAMADWDFGNYSMNDKVKFIMEGAYAYVIVKALFPVRLGFSLLGMPWFAKWFVLPFTNMFSRTRKTPPAPSTTPEQTVKKVTKPRL